MARLVRLVPAIDVFVAGAAGTRMPGMVDRFTQSAPGGLLRPGMTSSTKETTHETIRPHRKAARHQARKRLELEIHLRKDRRLLRSPDRRRHPRPDEIDKTASRQCRRAVRAVQIRGRDAQ